MRSGPSRMDMLSTTGVATYVSSRHLVLCQEPGNPDTDSRHVRPNTRGLFAEIEVGDLVTVSGFLIPSDRTPSRYRVIADKVLSICREEEPNHERRDR